MAQGIWATWKPGMMQADTDLLHQIAAGDENALRAFFDLHGNAMIAYACRLINDREMAEEVVQDSLVAVWKSAGSFQGKSKPLTWALGIVYHKAISTLRKRQDLSLNEDQVEYPESGSLETEVDTADRASILKKLLKHLPAEQSAVLELVFYHHLSLEETAVSLHCPIGTVKSRLFHARKTLKELLIRYGYTLEDLL